MLPSLFVPSSRKRVRNMNCSIRRWLLRTFSGTITWSVVTGEAVTCVTYLFAGDSAGHGGLLRALVAGAVLGSLLGIYFWFAVAQPRRDMRSAESKSGTSEPPVVKRIPGAFCRRLTVTTVSILPVAGAAFVLAYPERVGLSVAAGYKTALCLSVLAVLCSAAGTWWIRLQRSPTADSQERT
jgi:hypothetical protein